MDTLIRDEERKMKEEFNLSEKVIFAPRRWDKKPYGHLNLKDVKEFIKRNFIEMEDKLIGNKIKYCDVVRIVKKNAGEKLI